MNIKNLIAMASCFLIVPIFLLSMIACQGKPQEQEVDKQKVESLQTSIDVYVDLVQKIKKQNDIVDAFKDIQYFDPERPYLQWSKSSLPQELDDIVTHLNNAHDAMENVKQLVKQRINYPTGYNNVPQELKDKTGDSFLKALNESLEAQKILKKYKADHKLD